MNTLPREVLAQVLRPYLAVTDLRNLAMVDKSCLCLTTEALEISHRQHVNERLGQKERERWLIDPLQRVLRFGPRGLLCAQSDCKK